MPEGSALWTPARGDNLPWTPYESQIRRAPRVIVHHYATTAAQRGVKVLIAGAGAAAHLAGVVAAITPLPVIGVPLSATGLQGLDALLATVQMPGGIPVATMAIGEAGARNAGLFAVRMLAVGDPVLTEKLAEFHRRMAMEVQAKDARLQERLQAFNESAD
ncbi:AIR carboxylase family protein [Candidatus Magnetaquicoccus inordinatus]|uniref:AIR carboxylase family protein n=1 Tax=Candidatus Magnetaquicoccus inordinatus TaxID=2496818 RepID=UPI00102BAA83|nr:AIR carboxylase family protein [Candidatus Magnetaquicoccus inordinatus]